MQSWLVSCLFVRRLPSLNPRLADIVSGDCLEIFGKVRAVATEPGTHLHHLFPGGRRGTARRTGTKRRAQNNYLRKFSDFCERQFSEKLNRTLHSYHST